MSWAMLNRSISSMAGRASGGTYDVQEYFWGAELSKDKPTFKWNPEMDEEFSDTQSILFLKRAVLGVKAVEGERNIVEAHCTSMDEEEQKHPILSLTLGLEDHCDVELSFKHMDEVSFKLVAGSGPVHLVGQHYLETSREPGMDDTDMDEDVEDEDDLGVVEEEDEEEEAAAKPVGKKRKMAEPAKAKAEVPEDGPETKKIKAAKGATATNGGSAATNGAGTPKGKPNGTAKEAANGKTNGSTPSGKTPKKAKA